MASGCCVNGVHMKAACGVLSSPLPTTHTHTNTHRDGMESGRPVLRAWQISPQVLQRRERQICLASEAVPQGMKQPPQPPLPPFFQLHNYHHQPPLSLNQPPCINRHPHPPPLIPPHLNVRTSGQNTIEWFNVKRPRRAHAMQLQSITHHTLVDQITNGVIKKPEFLRIMTGFP